MFTKKTKIFLLLIAMLSAIAFTACGGGSGGGSGSGDGGGNTPPPASGSLDTTFGGDGTVVTSIAIGNYEELRALAIQPDGKIVAAGYANTANDDFAVVRYNSDGSLDNTFGGDGIVFTAIGNGSDVVRALALQSNGKIVAAGHYTTASGDTGIALARYNTNGALDTSFDGDGIFTYGSVKSAALAMAIQSDEKIVVGGYFNTANDLDFGLMRLNSDGSVDTSFGFFGFVRTNIDVAGGIDIIHALAIQPDGKIVAAGHTNNGTSDSIALARYNTNGTLDTSFAGGDGINILRINGIARALVIQPDNKIVVAGDAVSGATRNARIVRFNSDGGLDGSFGFLSIAGASMGGGYDEVRALSLQGDGKILVAGITAVGNSSGYSNPDFAMARFNTNGTIDTSFDGDGIVTTGVAGTLYDEAFAMAIQSDGKIVAAGYAYGSNLDFAVVRYNP